LCRAPEFLVTPLLMGSVCLLSQGRFEEPVRTCFCYRYSRFCAILSGRARSTNLG